MTSLDDSLFHPREEAVTQDWEQLRRYLAARGLGFGAAEPRQFAGGFGNLNYLVEIDGKPAVLRRPPVGNLPRGANDMTREYRILSSLWRAYPLAPRALLHCEEDRVLGAPFQLIEFRPGIIIRDALPPHAEGSGAVLSRHLVESLARLHAVVPAEVGLEGLGRPAGFLARTLDGWRARGEALADLLDERVWGELLVWLSGAIPGERPAYLIDPARLIHNDFKLDNMILDERSLDPAAIIDWDMGTLGDPLWDLAVLLSYWTEPQDPPQIKHMRQMPTEERGFWRRAEALSAYARLSGREIGEFRFYRVLSLLRTAIVFLQLFDRWRRSSRRDRRAQSFDVLGRALLEYALEAARGRAD
jgi:aminoglycoside phosphotransferase (APT) family kinase protein